AVSENIGPVIDGDGDHAFARHVLAVIARLRTIAVLEPTAENIKQDGEVLVARLRGSPDVQIEAVLAHAVAAEPIICVGRSQLHASRSELVGIADALPVLDGLGLAPAQVSDRRLAKRDALEAAHAVLGRNGGLQNAVRNL